MIINFQNVYIDNSLSKKVDETEADVSPYTKEVAIQTDTDAYPETNLKEEM